MTSDSPRPETPARSTYHHGNLVSSLISAAIELIEEKGVENLSVREVAKKAGVSPAAPFRHFASKTALLTAVAEQAMTRLAEAVADALLDLEGAPPLDRLRAVGRGYLHWALANPTHFQIISSRTLIDFHDSAWLVQENEALRRQMVSLVEEAQRNGDLREGLQLEDIVLSARAFVYGIARMAIDGHFPEWKVERPPEEATNRALDAFMLMLSPATPRA